MTEPSPTQQVLDRCRDALFTGIVRVHTRQAEGEVWFLSGILERVRFGVSLGNEAMGRLLAARDPRVEVVPCLPNPLGGFDKGHPIEGDLGTTLPMDLLRFCETHALTCTVDLRSGGSCGEAVYRLGDLISVRCDAGSDRAVAEMLEWRNGRFRFLLPSIELATSVAAAVDNAPPLEPIDEPLPSEAAAWRTAANEALKRKVVEVEAKLKAEEQRKADEVEAQRLADEAEAQRLANEAEAQRLADEAEAQRLANEVEAQRLADEAEAQRLANEVEAQRLADEVEAQRLANEVEAQRLAHEAEAQRLANEVEAQRLAHEAEAQRLANEAEAQRKADEADAAEAPRLPEPLRPAAEPPAFSVVVRLQRVTTEYVHIAVPVTRAMRKGAPEADGSYRVESAALFAEAERLARAGNVAWQPDGEPYVGPHPNQATPADARVQTPPARPGRPSRRRS